MTRQGPDERGLLLAEGTRLVHIGPPKTGTTAIQGAFHAARTELLAHGIRYAGPSRSPWRAAIAASSSGRRAAGGREAADEWQALLAEVRSASEPRVVISSEHFAKAQPAAVARIASALDIASLHVAVTLRPLARVLPSQWQQFLLNGLRTDFEPWLQHVLVANDGAEAAAFWLRHRHDELVARWVNVVGSERVTVIVVDERDHGFALRAFEDLLGARQGCLVSVPDLENRSLTWPEAEAIRHLNIAFHRARLPVDLNEVDILRSAATQMKRQAPAPDWPRIEMPLWAADRAGEISAEMVAGIAASGVRVVGDLETLTVASRGRPEDVPPPSAAVPPELAATMAMGVLVASGLARRRPDGSMYAAGDGPRWHASPELARLSTGELAGAIGRRGRNALVHRMRRLTRGGLR